MKYYATNITDGGTVAVDDTIQVKGFDTTVGSKILEGFRPLFSAEVVERLEHDGYTVSGKTHVGEFGLDLVGEFSHYGKQEDGALAGAAATLVANGDVKAALAVDMNGAPRRAAALSGVDFLKPTYGTVSRYGIVSCAASGEQVGVYAQHVDGVKEVLSVIAGHDPKDGTSLRTETYSYDTSANAAGKTVAIVKELLDAADEDTRSRVRAYAEVLRQNGVTVEEISLPLTDAANTAWRILMTAETCNNVSRYDGVKYGHRSEHYKNIDELYVNSRTEGFNFLTKAVILYGSDVLSAKRYTDCYDKSLRVRRVVAEAVKDLFRSYDALLTPACGKTAYAPYAVEQAFDVVFDEMRFTAIPNLIGTPALVSGGVQLMGDHFAESTLLSLAGCVERKGE